MKLKVGSWKLEVEKPKRIEKLVKKKSTILVTTVTSWIAIAFLFGLKKIIFYQKCDGKS